MNIEVRNLICLVTIVDNNIKFVSNSKKLFEIACNDKIDIINNKFINSIDIKNLTLEQVHTYNKKIDNELLFDILFVGLISSQDILNSNYDLTDINSIDNIYKEDIINYLKHKLIINNVMKDIYDNNFILPDLQKFYENLFRIKFDRRNFRKRLIKSDVILDMNKMSSTNMGRPAKMYSFKEKEDINIF